MEHVALVDMDGTIADYKGQMESDLASLMSPWEVEHLEGLEECGEYDTHISMSLHDDDALPYMKRRLRLIKEQTDWWYNLPPLPKGIEVVDLMEELGFEIHILTKGPYKTETAWTEKYRWCRKHLNPDVKVTITEDKGLVYGKVLFDDYPDYMDRWLKWRPRGLGIMPLTSYNKDYKHPNVIHFDGNNMDEIKERLITARDR